MGYIRRVSVEVVVDLAPAKDASMYLRNYQTAGFYTYQPSIQPSIYKIRKPLAVVEHSTHGMRVRFKPKETMQQPKPMTEQDSTCLFTY